MFLADRRGKDRGTREQRKGEGVNAEHGAWLSWRHAHTYLYAHITSNPHCRPAPFPPTGSMQTLQRPSQSAELVLDVAQLVLDMLPPLEDCVQRGGKWYISRVIPGPARGQTAERTAEASTTEGSMGNILAGVGVGVRKRSGLTGAPAVNFLSGFSAARRSIELFTPS